MPQDNIIIETEPIENPDYKGGPKRGQWQAMAERPKIAKWLLMGWTQERIAEELGLTQPMISYEKKQIEEAWKKSALFDFHRLRSEQIERLRLMIEELWDAWEKSKEGKEVINQERDEFGETKEVKDLSDPKQLPYKSRQVTDSAGDPRYMTLLKDLWKEWNKFMALDPILKNEDWKNQLPDGMTVEDVEKFFVDLIEGEASVIEDD